MTDQTADNTTRKSIELWALENLSKPEYAAFVLGRIHDGKLKRQLTVEGTLVPKVVYEQVYIQTHNKQIDIPMELPIEEAPVTDILIDFKNNAVLLRYLNEVPGATDKFLG